MKLVASLIVADIETGRYLDACLDHLADFCDDTVIVHDRQDGVDFFSDEGRARQHLLEQTLARDPTHVLAIDADEFVSDGAGLRRRLERAGRGHVWSARMEEVWELDGDCLCIRGDGGWRPHPVPIVWKVTLPAARYRIRNRRLACGRIPVQVAQTARRGGDTGVEILHFGWANEAERATRYQRYAVADGGRFHARRHLDSILWDPARVQLEGRRWPKGLSGYRDRISAHVLGKEPAWQD